jgi:hypothetical protein
LTPKNFRFVMRPDSDGRIPSGVWDYHRVPLRTVLPELGDINLTVYYMLRIACCAHLVVTGADKLQDCEVCENRGWVCPRCLGARWLSADGFDKSNMIRCPDCVYERVDEKGKIYGTFDPDRALQSARRWLVKRFPYGVPTDPTPADLALMDSY